MKKEDLLLRIQDLRTQIEQSANNHNALLGRLAEVTQMYHELENKDETIVDVVSE